MKNNIRLTHSLLLIPLFSTVALVSMERPINPLEESRIIIPEPTKRGLGFVRSSLDFIWNEEENTLSDVTNKTFDVQNSSYHRKLDAAVEIFVEKKNSDKLGELFTQCQTNYPKQIKIGDSQAVMAHKFLVNKNKEKQIITKEEIQKIDIQYLEKENELLATAKKQIAELIVLMNSVQTEHQQQRQLTITHACNEIRKIKNATINTHKLNKVFTLPTNENDGYCSDNEQDIKNPENIKTSYNDEKLLEKIGIANKVEETNQKINAFLFTIQDLESKLKAIQPLQY